MATQETPMTQAQEEVMKKQIIDMSMAEGVRAGIGAGIISGAGVLAANKYSPWFRKNLSVSGKLATVMICVTGAFHLVSELALIDSRRNPVIYGMIPTAEDADKHVEEVRKSELDFKQLKNKAMNYLYDHPYKMIIGLSLPVIGKIFYDELQKPGIKLSQRIIHTRVQGQMSVVGILAITMGFRDWMTRTYGGNIPE